MMPSEWMKFLDHPEFIWLLGLVPIVALMFIWEALRARRLMRMVGDEELIRRIHGQRPGWRRWLRRVLWLVALALVVIATTRPRWGYKTRRLQHVGIDVAVTLDVSRSMLVEDILPNRLQAVTAQVSTLLSRLPGGRVTLVPFAGIPFIQSPLTSDYGVLQQYLAELDPLSLAIPGTNIAMALQTSRTALGLGPVVTEDGEKKKRIQHKGASGSEHKAIVLFTDGACTVPTDGSTDRACEEETLEQLKPVLDQLEGDGIKVFAVGVGSITGKPVPILNDRGIQKSVEKDGEGRPVFSRLGDTVLRTIADRTGGRYFSLSSGQVTEELFVEMDRLQKKEYDEQVRKMREDHFDIPLGLAVVLLLLELFLSDARWRRRRTGKTVLAGIVVLSCLGCSFDSEHFQTRHGTVERALSALDQGDSESALKHIERALKQLPQSASLNLNEGIIRGQNDQFKKAIQALNTALASVPDAERGQVLRAIAYVYIRQAIAAEIAAQEPQQEGSTEDPAADAKQAWLEARNYLEKALEANYEPALVRQDLEAVLYRTDPPCSRRDGDVEPDEAPKGSPQKLEVDESYKATIKDRWLCTDDTDYFVFDAKKGTRLSAQLRPGERGDPSTLTVQGLDVAVEGNSVQKTLVEDKSITFVIQHDRELAAPNKYGLDLLALPPCAELDPHRGGRGGGMQQVDETADYLARICPGDTDLYLTELEVGERLVVLVDTLDPPQQGQGANPGQKPPEQAARVPGQPQQADLVVRVGDSRGSVLAKGTSRNGRTLAVGQAMVGGPHLIRVQPPMAQNGIEIPYWITVKKLKDCPRDNLDESAGGEQQANNRPDEATALQPDARAELLGRVCGIDPDWYQVQPDEEKDTAVEVLMSAPRNTLVVLGYSGDDVNKPNAKTTPMPNGYSIQVEKKKEATRVILRGQGPETDVVYVVWHGVQSPGDSSQDPDADESQQDQSENNQDSDSQSSPQPDQKAPLEQLLQNMDKNPKNLEAERAKRQMMQLLQDPQQAW